jgi:hypothetical protein
MGDIVKFNREPDQYICDCGCALFHWYDGFIRCVGCLSEFDPEDKEYD